MKIAFDAKRLFYNHSGLGNYSRSLVQKIRTLNVSDEIFLLTPATEETQYKQFLASEYKIIEARNRFLWRIKNMVNDLRMIEADIYHGLSNELPVGINNLTNTKSIVTIHDLIFMRHPQYYRRVDRILYTEKSKRACKDADHIVAVSEATKADIIHFFGVDVNKISVLYQGCDEIFYNHQENSSKVFSNRPYLLFVSAISERKNVQLIVKALSEIEKKKRPLLKVVGKGGKQLKQVKALIHELDLDGDVEFLGHVDKGTLKDLYTSAVCSIYPSLSEGFGIPIVESILCGTPVITSNISAMPEAAAGIGILIDPNSVSQLKRAILQQVNEIERIPKHKIEEVKKQFHPKKHALEVRNLYERVLKC